MKYKLSNLFWDYNYSDEELHDLLFGRTPEVRYLTRDVLLRRMFEYFNWFDIVKFINKDIFLTVINEEFTESIKSKDLKEGLLFVRKFLLERTLPASRLNSELNKYAWN